MNQDCQGLWSLLEGAENGASPVTKCYRSICYC